MKYDEVTISSTATNKRTSGYSMGGRKKRRTYRRTFKGSIFEIYAIDDLFQEGCIGLIQASDTYNPEMGASFYTHASLYIKGTILRFINTNGKCVTVPHEIGAECYRAKKAQTELTQKLKHTPTIEELAKHTKMSKEKLQTFYEISGKDSLNQSYCYEDGDKCELGETIADDRDFTISVEDKILVEQIKDAMSEILTEDEKKVMIAFLSTFGSCGIRYCSGTSPIIFTVAGFF